MQRTNANGITLAKCKTAKPGLAKRRRILEYRLKNRLKFARRRADNAQYICCSCLLFQRLPQFIEQPRVLDGNRGLRGKVFKKVNLFFSKWAALLAVDDESANQLIVFEHRYMNDIVRRLA